VGSRKRHVMSQSRHSHVWRRQFQGQFNLAALLLVGLALLGLTACQTTRQVSKDSLNEPSGFLGDYSRMSKDVEDRANLVYIKSGVPWTNYTKIWIKPIEIWRSEDPDAPMAKFTPEDQQRLINMFHTALANTLGTNHAIVEQGGPDVLIIHAALTDARKSKPVIGFVSSVYLPLKLVSLGKQAISGTAIGVGRVTIEAEFLDGQSNERLAALLDTRAGTTAIRSRFSWTWGDIERIFEYWAVRLATRFQEEKDALAPK
jgi:hypothetical protein